jgi:rsbT co-antagonist protein RsbR
MTSSLDLALADMLRSAEPDILAGWRQRLLATGGNHQSGLTPQRELASEMSELLRGLGQTLATPDDRFNEDSTHLLAATLRKASKVRATRGFSPEESLQFLLTCKEVLIETLHGRPELQQALLQATLRIERLMGRCVLVLAASFVEAREQVIVRQTESLREVSTPVISLWDSILLLPLIGVVDSVRARQISEQLLQAIGESECEVTLIDVTGVPVMDTSVARHIMKTVAAAEMLGTRVILTGISPSTAQTIVNLGIDLSGVPTRGSLKAGMALALSLTRRRIVDAMAA